MSIDAAKEYADQARADVKRIQSIYWSLFVFLAVVIYAAGFRSSQLRELETERRQTAGLLAAPWNKLRTFYEQGLPAADTYLSQEVQPRLRAFLRLGKYLSEMEEKSPATAKPVRTPAYYIAFVRDLGEYNRRLHTVNARFHFRTPFNDLDRSALESLLDVMTFAPRMDSSGSRDGQEFAFLLAKQAGTSQKALARLAALRARLDTGATLQESTRNLRIEMREIAGFGFLEPLDNFWLRQDPYGYDTTTLSEEEVGALRRMIDPVHPQVNTVGALNAKLIQLDDRIRTVRNSSDVPIPLLGFAMPLNTVGILGGLMNLALLIAYGGLIRRIRQRLKDYQVVAGDTCDHALLRAITAALPHAGNSQTAVLGSLVLIAPSIACSCLLLLRPDGRTGLGISLLLVGICLGMAWKLHGRIRELHLSIPGSSQS